MGPGPSDDKEAKILNRVIRWTSAGLEYEADPMQLEKLLRDLGLDDGVKPMSSPGVKMSAADVAEDAEERGEHDEGREAHDAPLGRSEGAACQPPCGLVRSCSFQGAPADDVRS